MYPNITSVEQLNEFMNFMFISMMLIGILFGLLPAFIAKKKGRKFWLWWLYGVAFWIVATPHSLLIKETEEFQLKHGMKKCPACAELIKEKATVCKHCSKVLN